MRRAAAPSWATVRGRHGTIPRVQVSPQVEHCSHAVAEALGSVRAEGLEPSAEGLALCGAIARGELEPEQAVAQLIAHHRR